MYVDSDINSYVLMMIRVKVDEYISMSEKASVLDIGVKGYVYVHILL